MSPKFCIVSFHQSARNQNLNINQGFKKERKNKSGVLPLISSLK